MQQRHGGASKQLLYNPAGLTHQIGGSATPSRTVAARGAVETTIDGAAGETGGEGQRVLGGGIIDISLSGEIRSEP